MSHTTILVIEPSGDARYFACAAHAPGGAFTIWMRLAERHLGKDIVNMMHEFHGETMQPLWELCEDERLAWWERICLIALTFDRIWVATPHLQRLLNAIQRWLNEYGHGQKNGEGYRSPNLEETYVAIVDAKIAIERDGKGYLGVCFLPTSVAEDVWSMPTSIDEDGEWEDSRRYNIFTDNEGHRELFTEFPELLLPEGAGLVGGWQLND
jgi:hypothetical protein